MERDYVTADWVRGISSSLSVEKFSKILQDLLLKIEISAKKGDNSCVTFDLPDPVEEELKKRKFKIQYYQSDNRDPRELIIIQ
jgi:hypothetical protein